MIVISGGAGTGGKVASILLLINAMINAADSNQMCEGLGD